MSLSGDYLLRTDCLATYRTLLAVGKTVVFTIGIDTGDSDYVMTVFGIEYNSTGNTDLICGTSSRITGKVIELRNNCLDKDNRVTYRAYLTIGKTILGTGGRVSFGCNFGVRECGNDYFGTY